MPWCASDINKKKKKKKSIHSKWTLSEIILSDLIPFFTTERCPFCELEVVRHFIIQWKISALAGIYFVELNSL